VRDPGASAGALNRMQIELIAGRVSALRQCFY
jgi:AhpD family alkylhydroperoxidase